MSHPHNPRVSLAAVEKATICSSNEDGSRVSDMLVACQFMLGCYSAASLPSSAKARMRGKVEQRFTPSRNLGLNPQQSISFGSAKGVDYATLQKLLPQITKPTNSHTSSSPTPSSHQPAKPANKPSTQAPPPYISSSPSSYPSSSSSSSIPSSSSPTPTATATSNTTFNRSNSFTDNSPKNPPPINSKPAQPSSIKRPEAPPAKRKFEEDEEEEGEENEKDGAFTTAKEKYLEDCASKDMRPRNNSKKSLGGRRKFVVPMKKDEKEEEPPPPPPKKQVNQGKSSAITKPPAQADPETNPSGIDSINGVPLDDDRLRNCEPRMLEIICNEILDKTPKVEWADIAGLEFAKAVVNEMVVWPMLRRDLFTGLRSPPKGLLLFGPPGTGKTLIGKAIASSSASTFFSITASSLTSKWIGDGEKMVRALFAVARCYQPAVIFIDEIDSLLTQRSDNEHEATRRIKNEFLIQWDGAGTNKDDQLLLVGATNRPHELDEAARRRLVKRVYIPLPDPPARTELIKNLLRKQDNSLTAEDVERVVQQTNGYSGADLHALCSEAALGPLRALRSKGQDIRNVAVDAVRPVSLGDFQKALRQVRASVGTTDLDIFVQWNEMYGSTKESEAPEEEEEEMEDE